MMIATDVCVAAGITYRRLDYWTRAGYVTPELATTGATGHPTLTPHEVAALPERWREPVSPGAGSVRFYSEEEADVVKRIALLIRLGLVLECAARVGRSWAEHPLWPVHLGQGVTLRLDDWHPEHVVHPFQQDFAAAYRAVHCEDGTR